ncbi:hypothetical protein GJV26_29450 [Massilia dura]|uniref:Uncharacterized protein n=1 Tax=Pseudoduganella dura TaxID=321982 RepID=A0A6I3XI84_9BURK|nr:hypothetical protein [Pseudoduganella dura]MUI16554.1 hypothetical protein [Pseudoduganella dura]GGY11624.1 hypothetical protein GCM10007386_47390 [Pseudoduganella dura]
MLKIVSTNETDITGLSSFTGIQKRLTEACEWLKRNGVQVSNTRVGRYLKILRELNEARANNSLDAYHEKNGHVWINAAFESEELIWLYNSLKEHSNEKVIERLKLAVKGNDLFATDESDNASGRNFSLELSTAGAFAATGSSVDFGGEADVRVLFHERELFIECKRLKSANKAEKRIKHGFEQLKKRYSTANSAKAARGILVLSISKLANEGFNLYKGKNPIELSQQLQAEARTFIEAHKQQLAKRTRDKRTIATVILYDAPGHTSDLFSINKYIVTVETYGNSVEDMLLRQRISATFSQALNKQISASQSL